MIPKYRAWQIPTERMREVTTLEFSGGDLKYIYFDDEKLGYLPSDVVLMQSTGLFDKNGQEIFEGDVVIQFNDYPHIVKFGQYDREEDFGRNSSNVGFYFRVNYDGEMENQEFDYRYTYEVIGNIYENKELVEPCN